MIQVRMPNKSSENRPGVIRLIHSHHYASKQPKMINWEIEINFILVMLFTCLEMILQQNMYLKFYYILIKKMCQHYGEIQENSSYTFPHNFYLLFRASSRAVTTSAGSGNFSLRGGPFLIPVHNTTSNDKIQGEMLYKIQLSEPWFWILQIKGDIFADSDGLNLQIYLHLPEIKQLIKYQVRAI